MRACDTCCFLRPSLGRPSPLDNHASASSRCSRSSSRPARISSTHLPTPTATATSTCSWASTASPTGCIATTRASFTDVAASAGVADARATRAAAWGDFDGDGDPDLLLGFTPGPDGVRAAAVSERSRHRSADTTTDGRAGRRDRRGPSTGVGGRRRRRRPRSLHRLSRPRQCALSQRRAARSPTLRRRIGLADPRKTVGAVWFDFDEDGDLDLAVANMDGDANGLFRNDGGTFTDVAEAAGVAWGGRAPRDPATARCACAPPTSTATAASTSSPPTTVRSGSSATAAAAGSRTARRRGVWPSTRATTRARRRTSITTASSISTSTARSPAAPAGRTRSSATPAPGFEDVTPPNIRALQADHGVQWADVDGDGDLDLALTGSRPDGMHLVMRNQLPAADARRSPAGARPRRRGPCHAGRRGSACLRRRVHAPPWRAARGRGIGLRRAERHARARRDSRRRVARGRAAHRAQGGAADAALDARRQSHGVARQGARGYGEAAQGSIPTLSLTAGEVT